MHYAKVTLAQKNSYQDSNLNKLYPQYHSFIPNKCLERCDGAPPIIMPYI